MKAAFITAVLATTASAAVIGRGNSWEATEVAPTTSETPAPETWKEVPSPVAPTTTEEETSWKEVPTPVAPTTKEEWSEVSPGPFFSHSSYCHHACAPGSRVF